MELDWSNNEERQRGTLRYSFGPKTTWRRMVEDERRTAGWQSWVTVRALAADRGGWNENVKALCALWRGETDRHRRKHIDK